MALDYDAVMAVRVAGKCRYSDTETMLYALGVGMGRDPMNEKELPFVYEKNLKVIPTMACTLGDTFDNTHLTNCGVNTQMIVHGDEKLVLHRPLPPAATISYDFGVKAIIDKGKDKGALMVTENKVELEDGTPLFTLTRTIFARGDGGFGGSREGLPIPQVLPERKADVTCTLDTRPDQALLYRLSGDRNPLHAEPEFARVAGFPKPILHGLCSFGTSCRGLLTHMLDYDTLRIKTMEARFSAAVFPGDTLFMEMWDEGNHILFRTKNKESGVVVMNNGRLNLT